jgi:hypothetical protein
VSWLGLLERLGQLPAEAWLIPPAVIIAALLMAGLARRAARLRRYRVIAARTGLVVTATLVDPPRLSGSYGGQALVLTTTGARNAPFFRRIWTHVVADVRNPQSVGLHLRRRDVFDRLFRLGNAPVGDADFDRRFLTLSKDKGYVMMIFERPVREAMVRADVERVRLSGTMLEVFYRRETRDPEHAVRLLEATAAIAAAVDRLGLGRR